MDRFLGTEILVQKPAEFEYRDGLVHVVSWLGDNIALRLAYPVHLFIGNVLSAQEAIAVWKLATISGANVVPLRRRK